MTAPLSSLLAILMSALLAPGVVNPQARAQPVPQPQLARQAQPAPPRPERLVSPQVAADGQVTFRLRAPRAREVLLEGLGKTKIPLLQDAQGVWTARVGPLEPGLHEYNFSVDGLAMLDPLNPQLQPQYEPTTSIVEIPGTPARLTEFQDVPHGTMHVHHYRAKSLGGRPRRVHVYTPPGYDGKTAGRLPVLYLLHGSGDNDATWSVYGRANFILDNLLAQTKAQPMLVVMPDGHALPRGSTPPGAPQPDNTAAFAQELLDEVIPLVEQSYRVRKDSQARAIAGLSMGGRQALTIGLGHPDRFAWVGAMSASVPPDSALATALADPQAINRRLRWLWIACGNADTGFQRNQTLVATLADKGIKHIWKPSDGGHTWPLWRGYLTEIAPQLFRLAPTP